jgi:hypothetical protein
MDPVTILSDVGYVLQLANMAIAAATDAAPFVETAIGLVEGKTGLTDAQRASLLQQETALRAQLDQPSIAADQD